MSHRQYRGLLGWYDRRWHKRQVARIAREWGITPAEAEAKQRQIERIVDGIESFTDALNGEIRQRAGGVS